MLAVAAVVVVMFLLPVLYARCTASSARRPHRRHGVNIDVAITGGVDGAVSSVMNNDDYYNLGPCLRLLEWRAT